MDVRHDLVFEDSGLRRLMGHSRPLYQDDWSSFHRRLEDALDQARQMRVPLGLQVLCIDRYAAIADEHGAEVAARAASWVGNVIMAASRIGDTVCRIDADEFAVLMPWVTRREMEQVASNIARMARGGIGRPASLFRVPIGLAVGVAMAPEEAESSSELMIVAEGGMYQSKRSQLLLAA